MTGLLASMTGSSELIIKNIVLPNLVNYYYAGDDGKIYRLSDCRLIEVSPVFPNPKYQVKHVNLKFIVDRKKVTRTIPIHVLIASCFHGEYHRDQYKVVFVNRDLKDTRPVNLKWQVKQ